MESRHPGSQATSDGGDRIPALDGLRATACLMVVWYHASHRLGVADDGAQGAIGVALFFTLSGFLIAHLYMEKPLTLRSAGDYVIARIARIAPVYLFVVLASWVAYNFVDPGFPIEMTHAKLPRHLLFSGDVRLFWSIPPEVQFYGLFLILWAGVWRAVRFQNVVLLICFVLFCLVAMAFGQNMPGTVVASKLPYFLLGALAGWLFHRLRSVDIPMRLRLVAQLVLISLLAAAFATETQGFLFIGPSIYGGANETVYADMRIATIVAALVLSLALETRFSTALFGNAVIRRLGAYSFSLYLVHTIMLHYTGLAASELGLTAAWGVATTFALLLPVGWASFTFLESPGRRLSRRVLSNLLRRSVSRWESRMIGHLQGSEYIPQK